MHRRLLGLFLLLSLTTGCYTWHRAGIQPRRWLENSKPHVVRVTTRDNDIVLMDNPVTSHDSIVGRAPKDTTSRSLPWAEVYRVEYRSFDPGKLALVGVGGVIIWAFVLCNCVTQ